MALKLNKDGSYTDPRTRETYDPDQITSILTGDAETGYYYVPGLKTGAKTRQQLAVYSPPTTGAGASWVADPLTTPGYESSGAEGGYVEGGPDNRIRSYWMQFLPQLGFTGPLEETVGSGEDAIKVISQEALAAIDQFRRQGYDIVRNPQRTDAGSKGITEYGLRLPSGELAGTWEYKAGAWYEQMAPYLGLVLPGILGMAGITAGSLGASITGQTSNALLNNAVGGAIIGGAKELITSGGDVESAIKGALTGGALGAAAELAQPYIKDAANALSQLTGEEVAELASTDVAADVAGDLGNVDVGGGTSVFGYGGAGDVSIQDVALGADPLYGGAYTRFNTAQSYSNLTDAGKTVYAEELALGKSPDAALISAFRAESLNPPLTGNALATGGAAAPVTPPPSGGTSVSGYGGAGDFQAIPPSGGTSVFGYGGAGDVSIQDVGGGTSVSGYGGAGDFQAIDVAGLNATTGVTNALTGGTVVPVSAGGVADTLSTGMQEELNLTGAYTGGNAAADAALGLGAAGTAAGVAGAGAAAAGAAGAGAGTAAGAGGEMIDVGTDPLYGGAYTGSGAAESALTGATAGAAAGAAAGLTGIPVVDDFLKYIGTPAGAAALGAFGSLAGGYLTGQAAKDAANIQAQSAANALKLQEDQFEYQKSLLEPYRARGESALNRLAGVMGLDGQPAQPQQLLDMDPGYAFRLGEGMKALERVQAARGNMLSGGAIKAGQRYAQDFASGEYGNAYNRLANIAGLGQTVGGQLGTAAQQFGQTAGETMSQGANALAAGRIGRTSGYMGGIGGAVGAYQNYQNQQQQNQLFGKFLDIYGRAVGAGS